MKKITIIMHVIFEGVKFAIFCLLGKRKKFEERNLSLHAYQSLKAWNQGYYKYLADVEKLKVDYETKRFTSSAFQSVVNYATNGLEKPKILEVGLGRVGDLIAIKKELGEVELFGADYSDVVLNLGKNLSTLLNIDINLVKSDARHLPFDNNTFDIVFHQGLLEHFTNPSDIMREHSRIIKEGGILIVSVPQLYHTYTLYKQALIRLDRFGGVWETEYSAKELIALSKSCELKVIEIVGRGSLFDNWIYSKAIRFLPRLSEFFQRHFHKYFSVSIVIVLKKLNSNRNNHCKFYNRMME